MEPSILFDQNPWWKDKSLIGQDYDIIKWKEKKYRWIPDLVEKIHLEPFSMHIITGPRQAGKTTVLKLVIKRLLEKETPQSIFYFNCENLGDYKELTSVIETYLQFKESNSVKCQNFPPVYDWRQALLASI